MGTYHALHVPLVVRRLVQIMREHPPRTFKSIDTAQRYCCPPNWSARKTPRGEKEVKEQRRMIAEYSRLRYNVSKGIGQLRHAWSAALTGHND